MMYVARLGETQTMTLPAGGRGSLSARGGGVYMVNADGPCLLGSGGMVALSGAPFTPGTPWFVWLDDGEQIFATATSPLTVAVTRCCDPSSR